MKNKVLLILGILEGQGWNPFEGSKTIIEATLDSIKLCTEAVPLSNSPKFNTEVAWEAERQTIRNYKLKRVPIKIECLALNEKGNRKSLGYIVLPLSSAVEGVKVDSKWHKLLGGSKSAHKTAPCILLHLHLESMTLEQHNQVNGRHLPVKNGTQALEKGKKTCPREDSNIPQNAFEVQNLKQENGELKSTKDNNIEVARIQAQNSELYRQSQSSNGICSEKKRYESSFNSNEGEDEEDLSEYDSDECSDTDLNEASDMILDAYSICKSNFSATDAETSNKRLNTCFVDVGPKEPSGDKIKSSHPVDSTTSSKASEKFPSLHEDTLKARATAREHLHKVSETLLNSKSPSSPISDRCSSLEKRILQTSHLLDEPFEQKSKSRKIDKSLEENSRVEKSLPVENNNEDTDELKRRLSFNQSATSAAVLLSQSIEENPKFNKNSQKSQNERRIVPHLNQEEGYFSIGPCQGEKEEAFVFCVTVMYAKNLSSIIPKERIPFLNEGFKFCYSLLGYCIYTDTFRNLDNPEFLAEKASASIRSSHESLSKYFSQHFFLPVYLMSGETALGLCSVDTNQLIEISCKNQVKIEGVYELNPTPDIKTESIQNYKAVVALSFEVSKILSHDIVNKSEIAFSDSLSSDFERDEVHNIKRLKRRKERSRSSSLYVNTSKERIRSILESEEDNGREKRLKLLEAAREIELWKEEQQKKFLKEWSEKEETLQKLLASEWSSKAKIIEEELNHRLNECDKLQEKLNAGLRELSIREKNVKVKEDRVDRLEQELTLEKERFLNTKLRNQSKDNNASKEVNFLTKQLEAEKVKRERLQKEVNKLQTDMTNSEEKLKGQADEIINLRRKLILSDDIIGITKEKDILQSKVESLQERKQYYKTQWLTALTDLHKFHSAHKKTIDEITQDMQMHSTQGKGFRDKLRTQAADHFSSHKLKKLNDERKFLLETGLYPQNHSIIRNIDKKIKEILG